MMNSPQVTKKYKVLTGQVVQNSLAKTISVKVSTYKNHPLYQKRYLSSKKYLVHDEHNQAQMGDRVQIIACRPLSRRKRFRLTRVLAVAKTVVAAK